MQYRKSKDGISISLLGFGCMRLPLTDPGKPSSIDYKKSFELIDTAFKNGVNYFDTAYPYHDQKSEEFVKFALKDYPRESYYLADKMPGWDVKNLDDAVRIFNLQLQRTGQQYFDFYLCHALSKSNWTVYEEFLLDFLIEQKKRGFIKRLGFSFHDTPKTLTKIADAYDWDFAQLQINYLDWTHQDAKGQYEILTSKKIPIIVMEPLRGGALANLTEPAADILKTVNQNASPASWALRYVMSLDNVLTVLSGMSNMEQVLDNIKTAENFVKLEQNQYPIFEKVLTEQRRAIAIPCTNCKYCMSCAHGVDIPLNFEVYNYSMANLKAGVSRYNQLGSRMAQSCKGCGICSKECPQGIDIPAQLKKVHKRLGL